MSECAIGWIPYNVKAENIKKAIQKLYNYKKILNDDIVGNCGYIFYKDRMVFYDANVYPEVDTLWLDKGKKINAGKGWTYLSLGADEEGQKIIKDLIEVFGGYYDYNDCANGIYEFIKPKKENIGIRRYIEKTNKKEMLKLVENLLKLGTKKDFELIYDQNEDNSASKIVMNKKENNRVIYTIEQDTSMDSETAFFKKIVKILKKQELIMRYRKGAK